jgi:hypothetical protein
VGLALIAVAFLGAMLVLLEDDDDREPREPAQEATGQPLPEPGESLDAAASGISAKWPSDWTKLEKGGVLAFRSPDKTVLVGISAPGDAADAGELRKGAIASAADAYKDPVVRPGKGSTIGGLEASGATIRGEGSGGGRVTLVAVAAGRQKAYLLEVVSADNAPPQRVVEAQQILNSLQLTK